MKKAKKLYDYAKGDVPATWADASLLQNLTGYKPQTHFKDALQIL